MIPGGLAQLARALALQARGHRFDSDILHFFFFEVEKRNGDQDKGSNDTTKM